MTLPGIGDGLVVQMRGRSVRIATASLAILLLAASFGNAPAAAKVKTFSSGPINRPIPDPVGSFAVEIGPSIKVERRGRVKDVNVAVRISHPDARELVLGSSHAPKGGVVRFTTLKERGQLNEPAGADFGAGAPGCQGASFTVFDSQASTSIYGATPPFAGSFIPASPLTPYNGTRLQGRWYLDLLDTTDGNEGILHCWQVTIRYKPARKKR